MGVFLFHEPLPNNSHLVALKLIQATSRGMLERTKHINKTNNKEEDFKMSQPNIKVYTPEGFCPRCLIIKNRLNSLDLEYTEQTATEEETEHFREVENLRSFPVVKVISETGEVIKTITGLDTDSIDEIPELQACMN